MKKKKSSWSINARSKVKSLSHDQVRFNKTAAKKKGTPGSAPFKRYVFGHATNVRKGRA